MTEEERKAHIEEVSIELSRRLADRGKLIEAGWIALVVTMKIPPDLRPTMRLAYMAGAQHLFGSIMNMMDPGMEPTEADLRKMSLIDEEMRQWAKELQQRFPHVGGRQ